MTDTTQHTVFARNLDRLLATEGWSRTDAAVALGVDYKWLRRAVSSGIDRIERRNQPALDAVVRHFRLSSVNDLWHPNLVAVEVRPKDVVTPPRSSRPRRPLLFQWPEHKHRQAARIVSLLPEEIATYHEPFVGDGGVLLHLLQSAVRVKRYVAGDHYAPLVEMWRAVKDAPATVMVEYRRQWRLLADTGRPAYDEVRRQFNFDHDPLKLFFLLRVTRDGRKVLGPGRAELLEHIDRLHSISAAAREMNMSYRRAWELVCDANDAAGVELVAVTVGGSGGGGATLTPHGHAALRLYRDLLARFGRTAAQAALPEDLLSAPTARK